MDTIERLTGSYEGTGEWHEATGKSMTYTVHQTTRATADGFEIAFKHDFADGTVVNARFHNRVEGDPAPRMIPGLRYVPGYIDDAGHGALLAAVDAGAWRDFGERRAQIYGYSYHYLKGGLYRVEDLPPWGEALSARLVGDGLMPEPADQLIVNDYSAGQGIPAHVDAPLFTDTIISVSLGSSCVMEFTNETGGTEEQFLEPMSVLVIGGHARHEWKHSIPSRMVDHWQGREWPRGRRVSLTFRKISKNACAQPDRAARVPLTPYRAPRSTP